ncbi:MAG: hypothetical protein P8Z33_11555 [Gammaproteobacteria bacterium]|jgi:hypothetical protein
MLRTTVWIAALGLLSGCSAQSWAWVGKEVIEEVVEKDYRPPPNQVLACQLDPTKCDEINRR